MIVPDRKTERKDIWLYSGKRKRVRAMRKLTTYLILGTMLLSLLSFGDPITVQAAESRLIGTVAKVDTLTGIQKIETGTVNAVILGDSIAVSQGATNPLRTGWTRELKRALVKKYSHRIAWDNKASSGTLVDYCLTRATEIESNTDVVFICVGRNDRNEYTPYQFSKKYELLIRVIKRKAPKADIFCIVEPPMVADDESLFLGIRAAIKSVSAKAGVNLLDVWSTFPKDQEDLDELLSDGLHPNDEGYKLMSNYIYNRLVWVVNTAK